MSGVRMYKAFVFCKTFLRNACQSRDTTPCKVTPVILHGVVSPAPGTRRPVRLSSLLRFMTLDTGPNKALLGPQLALQVE